MLHNVLESAQLLAEGIGAHSWAIVGRTAAEFGRARVLEAMSDASTTHQAESLKDGYDSLKS